MVPPNNLRSSSGLLPCTLLYRCESKVTCCTYLLRHRSTNASRAVARVEHLLRDVEHGVRGPVRAIVIVNVRELDLGLAGEASAALHELTCGLGCHAAGLRGEVDALAVAGGVDERDAALHAAGAGGLRDGVRLYLQIRTCEPHTLWTKAIHMCEQRGIRGGSPD